MITLPELPPFPTYEQVEAYIYSLEEYVHLPADISQIIHHLYQDLMRFGPPAFPEMPTFERFVQVPAPPPPPPPKSTSEKALDWIYEHKWITAFAAVGALSYGVYRFQAANRNLADLQKKRHHRNKFGKAAEGQRDIVIILGADSTSYGPSIVRDFQRSGYIVIASVLSGEAADDLERDGDGYVRALVLDAEELGSIPHFLRSLSSTLSLRFPTNIHGDPYLSMSSSQSAVSNLSHVASVISLLSLAPSDLVPFSAYTSPIILAETHIHHLTSRALTPLSIIQATLPLFRHRKALGSPAQGIDVPNGASIILCVPAVARVGAYGSSSLSMSSDAAVRGFEVLRREVMVDPALSNKHLGFVTLDVGEIGNDGRLSNEGRIPSDVSVLSSTLLGIVSRRRVPWTLNWVFDAWKGGRRNVGAGALTYAAASRLPNILLDFMLALPYRLENMRSSLYPPAPSPTVLGPGTEARPRVLETVSPTVVSSERRTDSGDDVDSQAPSEEMASEPESRSESSAADVESSSQSHSNSGPNTIADSWVSLQDSRTGLDQDAEV